MKGGWVYPQRSLDLSTYQVLEKHGPDSVWHDFWTNGEDIRQSFQVAISAFWPCTVANSPVEVGSWNIPIFIYYGVLKYILGGDRRISAINYISSIFEASTSHPGPGGDSSSVRIIPWLGYVTWLGSPPFISHFACVHFGRGLTTGSLGHGTINHGYPWTQWWGSHPPGVPPPPLVPKPPSDPQTYRSSEWMQGPQLREANVFLYVTFSRRWKRSREVQNSEKKNTSFWRGDHAFLGNLYQVYKMIIHQVLLMMGVWEIHVSLVDGFIPPIWNIWSSNWIILPKYRGKNKDYLSNHHLGFGSERTKLTKHAFPKKENHQYHGPNGLGKLVTSGYQTTNYGKHTSLTLSLLELSL